MSILRRTLKYLIYELPRRLLHYCRWVGLVRGVQLWLLQVLRIRREVPVVMNGHRLILRSNSPDAIVAASCLISREYADIRCDNAKFIIDAGANIGTSAMWFATAYPEATVVAVEPEAENFDLLVRNTRHLTNVVPLQAAIWSHATELPLQDRQTGQWGYTLVPGEQTQAMSQMIECTTVPLLMKEHGHEEIDILKVDIEGGEKDLLEHSQDWIAKVRVLTAELHDRIQMGCDRAFYLATAKFSHFQRQGEKVTAYRDP